MTEYGEDKAQSNVNKTSLEGEFNLDSSEKTTQQIQDIKEMRQALVDTIGDSNRDPDDILYVNINRANDLLDIVQNNINDGGTSNMRLFEVSVQLVNAITSAATSVQNSSFGMMKHEYNMKMVEIKESDVAVRAALAKDKYGQKGSGPAEGVVVMTREALLDVISSGDRDVELLSSGEE